MKAIAAIFNHKPYFVQLLYLLFLLLFCYSLFSVAEIVVLLIAGYNLSDIGSLVEHIDEHHIGMLKVLQVVTTIGVFLVPALAFAYLKNSTAATYLRLQWPVDGKLALLAVMVTISSLPLMAFFMDMNQAITLPSFLAGLEQWMREMESSAETLTYAFLKMDSPVQLLINIFVIALLPAIGEELLFRGCLQQLLIEWTRKPHKAIFLSAALFSAIHFQFFGFIPRMLIGAFLGYLFYWSGNLWYPIIGHFVNNALQVIVYYFTQTDISSSELKPIESLPTSSVLVGTAVFSATIYLFYKKCLPLTTHHSGNKETIA